MRRLEGARDAGTGEIFSLALVSSMEMNVLKPTGFKGLIANTECCLGAFLTFGQESALSSAGARSNSAANLDSSCQKNVYSLKAKRDESRKC